jgi:hypothetical protein
LVVLIQGAIDGYAWEDTSFTVTNWFRVNELWPPNPASAPTETPVSEALEGTVEAPPTPKPKMRQCVWVKGRLTTKEARDALVREYDRLGEAVNALNREMENAPDVDAYANPRAMEPILRGMKLYPKGKRLRK